METLAVRVETLAVRVETLAVRVETLAVQVETLAVQVETLAVLARQKIPAVPAPAVLVPVVPSPAVPVVPTPAVPVVQVPAVPVVQVPAARVPVAVKIAIVHLTRVPAVLSMNLSAVLLYLKNYTMELPILAQARL